MGERTDDIRFIIESAARLGVELDEQSTLQWLAALSTQDDSDIVVDTETGTFGHRLSMLDFSPATVQRFRRIGEIVKVTGPAGVVEGALAISGSAAQSKIQSFPGDCDFFQRLNIRADTHDAACLMMAQLFRDKILSTSSGPSFQFLEAKLGSFPFDCVVAGQARRAGTPISWSLADVMAGQIRVVRSDGTDATLSWNEVALDPGWCKLDWVVVDAERRGLSNASNVIDVTWEGPDGEIVALDGYLDAYFQEVYLDAGEAPVFAKLAEFVSDDALDEYVERLEAEVRKYLTDHLNYGKAAKRMYNVFRLSGRHLDAAFVRELFDEPATILYQVWSLVVTLENASVPGSGIPIAAVQAQADQLILDVVAALEGDEETEVVAALMALRQTLDGQHSGADLTAQVVGAQARVINVINTFYRERLMAMPDIREYIERMQSADG